MTMKAGVLFQPGPDLGVIVRAVVVQNHMDGQILGGFTIDLAQKFSEFEVPMPRVTRAEDLPLQHIQCRKQTGGPVAFVIVRHRPTTPFLHWQPRLRPVQGLHLRFLIHAQNDGLVRWVQVYPHHVRQLFYKAFVLRKLKPFHEVRFISG